MSALLKRAFEKLLRHGGAARVGRSRLRGGRLVLAYHNVIPPGHCPGRDRSLHLPQADFAAQLDLLQKLVEVVPLSRLLSSLPGGSQAAPRVAITFDDAYAGALTAGLVELRARSLPATVFVAPAFVGQGGFWWDEVVPAGASGLTETFRRRALEEWQGKDALIRARATAEGGRVAEAPPHCRCSEEQQLHEAVAVPGLTVGSHTWSHPNLEALSEGELVEELTRPQEYLQRFGAALVPVLSYPYGRGAGAVARAAAAAGYQAAFRVDGGWLPRTGASMFTLPRLNVPAGLSLDGFALRLAGLLC